LSLDLVLFVAAVVAVPPMAHWTAPLQRPSQRHPPKEQASAATSTAKSRKMSARVRLGETHGPQRV